MDWLRVFWSVVAALSLAVLYGSLLVLIYRRRRHPKVGSYGRATFDKGPHDAG